MDTTCKVTKSKTCFIVLNALLILALVISSFIGATDPKHFTSFRDLPLFKVSGVAGTNQTTLFSREYAAPFSYDWRLEFLQRTRIGVTYSSNQLPLLSIFVRYGGKYIRRIVKSIDFPLGELLIIQDGEDKRVLQAIDEAVAELQYSSLTLISKVRHVINTQHTGCSRAWNTVFRLYPEHAFWPMMSDDVYFEAGQLEKFYLALLEIQKPEKVDRVGAISASMRFPNVTELRTTFGLMAWAITRAATLKAGLFDENFFPAYYEDDDYVLRMFLAELEVYALPDVVAYHGDTENAVGYVGGSGKQADSVQANEYNSELGRAQHEEYMKFKWGRAAGSFSYAWSLSEIRDACARGERFCSPYGIGHRSISYWPFFAERHYCILAQGPDVETSLVKESPSCHEMMTRSAALIHALLPA